MEHHTDEWFTRPTFSMLSPCWRFFDKSCSLKGSFDKGIAAANAVMVPEFFMEVSNIKIAIGGSVQIQDCLEFLERDAFWAWSFHAPVKDTVVAVSFVASFPAFHGPVRDADDIGGLSPKDLFRSGL